MYVPQHEQHAVYDMGLVLFKEEVSCAVILPMVRRAARGFCCLAMIEMYSTRISQIL